MHFCLKDDKKTQNFKEKFLEYYNKAVLESVDFLSLQQLDKVEANYFQYFDSNYLGEISNYDTKFDKEGMLMSKDSSKKMTLVKYSFRYDELLSCKPIPFQDFLKTIDEKSKKTLKSESCCAAYAVSWGVFVSRVAFCSLLPEECNIHIKFFKSTLYKKCFENNLIRLNDLLKKLEDGTGGTLSIKDMAQLLNLTKDVKDKDLSKFYDKNSLIGNNLKELEKKADDIKHEILPALFDEVNKDGNSNKENSLFGYNSNANGGDSTNDVNGENNVEKDKMTDRDGDSKDVGSAPELGANSRYIIM
jgi:hypothetical protein